MSAGDNETATGGPRTRRRPTQADVARQAGVSQAMVSYVLNDNANIAIPEATRQRILDSMRDLGYVPNRTARSLRTQSTQIIACVVPDITNPFHTSFVKGLQAVAESHGYDVAFYNTDRLEAKEHKILSLVLEGRADGLVITPLHLSAGDFEPILKAGVPVVVQGPNTMPAELAGMPLDSLRIDDVAAAREAVSLLAATGHTRIGMLAGQQNTPPQQQREKGYREALDAHGIQYDPSIVLGGEFREEDAHQAMRKLLSLPDPPTAVFAASDLMAIGAIAAVHEAGLAVPDDVAVVGFDDIPVARHVHPPLTTISQFEENIGRRAAEMLFERLSADAPLDGRREVLPFKLTIRESATRSRRS